MLENSAALFSSAETLRALGGAVRIERAVLFCLGLACLVLAGCAAGSNEQLNMPSSEGLIAGFWRGLWKGLINSHVQPYEVHNNGAWYNFGFLFGLSIVFGGGSHGATRRGYAVKRVTVMTGARV